MAGHMKSPRGPHAARGPRVGQHWSRCTRRRCTMRILRTWFVSYCT